MTHKPARPAIAPIRLATNRQDLARSATNAASTRLGGVSVWAATEDELSAGIGALGEAISACAKLHLSLTKAVLRKLVRARRSDSQIEDRLFSALLGSVLRRGELDVMVCASKNDRRFRVILHASQIDRFKQALTTAETMLRTERAIEVPRLEKVIFGKRSYNTWSSTSHVLGRISYLGLGRLDADGRCHLVDKIAC